MSEKASAAPHFRSQLNRVKSMDCIRIANHCFHYLFFLQSLRDLNAQTIWQRLTITRIAVAQPDLVNIPQ